MSALITQAQWEAVVGADVVAAFTDSDASVIATTLNSASDVLREYAVEAGVVLTTLTPAMVRRVALIATYHASTRRPEYRDATGRYPYALQHEETIQWLADWASRTAKTSDAQVSTAPLVESDDARGW